MCDAGLRPVGILEPPDVTASWHQAIDLCVHICVFVSACTNADPYGAKNNVMKYCEPPAGHEAMPEGRCLGLE